MGNRPSRRQRQAAQIKETAPVSNPRNQDPEYDQQSLVDGLMSISKFLSKKKHKVMMVAVGGAVSTILLQSRQSTHDFDFLAENLNPKTSDALRKAVEKATLQSQVLQQGWINNQTTVFLTPDKRRLLMEQAIVQNEVVFASTSLTVLAAPWGYAFCSKLHRLSGAHNQTKGTDVEDAVVYVRKYLETKKTVSIRMEEIQELCGDY